MTIQSDLHLVQMLQSDRKVNVELVWDIDVKNVHVEVQNAAISR